MMATSRAQIRAWFRSGVRLGATHMLVAYDTFDYIDYPIYVTSAKEASLTLLGFDSREDKVMEVYNLRLDMETQLAEPRAWHLSDLPAPSEPVDVRLEIAGLLDLLTDI